MPKYKVDVEWSVDMSGTQCVAVEADSETEAQEAALGAFDNREALQEAQVSDFDLEAGEAELVEDGDEEKDGD